MQAYKLFHFSSHNNGKVKELDVTITEVIDPQYGLFTWPSAPVLAQFIFHNQHLVTKKNVLEIGCGTALAGVVAAKLGANVTLSDAENCHNCLENCRKCCMMNDLIDVKIIPITWGNITEDILHLNNIDIIVGSDCFYDKKDFEDILFTISFLFKRNPNAVFWTTYQLRNCNYSIEELLMKWNLTSRSIPLEDFHADGEYVGGVDMSLNHIIQMFEICRS